jgi:hypothetical protein
MALAIWNWLYVHISVEQAFGASAQLSIAIKLLARGAIIQTTDGTDNTDNTDRIKGGSDVDF